MHLPALLQPLSCFEVQWLNGPTSRIGSLEHVASTCCARVLTHVEQDTEHHQGNSGAGAAMTMTMLAAVMIMMIEEGGRVGWMMA